MNCKNCGEKLSAFSAYCEKCGQKAFSTKEWLAYHGKLLLAFLKKRLWLVIIVSVVIIGTIAVSIIASASKQIDPLDYITVDVSGYSGAGTIKVGIDYETLADKILGPVPDKNTAKGYEEYVEYTKHLEKLENSLYVSADKYRGLSNGDYFLVTITVEDAELFNECGFNLKKSEYSKAINIGKDCTTLAEPTEFDLLNHIDVMFHGENGNGYTIISDEKTYASIILNDNSTTKIEMLCYENWFGGGYTCSIYLTETGKSASIKLNIDNQSNVSNGDTVTISIDDTDITTLVEYGILITPSNRTYQVKNLT